MTIDIITDQSEQAMYLRIAYLGRKGDSDKYQSPKYAAVISPSTTLENYVIASPPQVKYGLDDLAQRAASNYLAASYFKSPPFEQTSSDARPYSLDSAVNYEHGALYGRREPVSIYAGLDR